MFKEKLLPQNFETGFLFRKCKGKTNSSTEQKKQIKRLQNLLYTNTMKEKKNKFQ